MATNYPWLNPNPAMGVFCDVWWNGMRQSFTVYLDIFTYQQSLNSNTEFNVHFAKVTDDSSTIYLQHKNVNITLFIINYDYEVLHALRCAINSKQAG